MSPETMEAAPPPRRRTLATRVCLVVASVLLVLSIFAVWANRQLLNADNWATTSTKVLQDPAVKGQVANFLVDEAYANVDVSAELKSALPPRFGPLSGIAAGGLRELSVRVTRELLGRPRVEQAWKDANRITAQQFINVAENKQGGAIGAQGNAVVLDLRVLVLDLVQRLGLPGRLTQQIPPSAGKVKILDANEVQSVQDGARILSGLAILLPILSLGLFAGAVALAAGHRRQTLMWVGIDLVGAGVLVLLLRAVLGGYVVDQLAGDGSVRDAAEATWNIGTSMLRDVAGACIIGGLPLLFAAWVAGPRRSATAVRRRLAPVLRDQPGVAYAVLAVVLLLIIAWGPIPATQKLIPVLIMCALAFFGLAVLRRQTLEEFPEPVAIPEGEPPEPPVQERPPSGRFARQG
jgi:hypothetical protein